MQSDMYDHCLLEDPSSFSEGKCSHGGPRDSSSTTAAALGGINKDSMDANYSPHHLLHEKAAELAIQHTRFFFDDPSNDFRHMKEMYGILTFALLLIKIRDPIGKSVEF